MFLAEPVQGAGGVIPPQDEYFPRIREICDRYDVLFVSDEVITGFARTGRMFALERWGVEPDMFQFAKAVTSGYFPMGGVGMSDRVAEVVNSGEQVWMHAYTYSGHPVGCRVALTMLDIIRDEDFVGQAEEKGRYLLNGLDAALSDHPHVGDVRGLGLMCGVEIVKDKATKEEFAPSEKIGIRVHDECARRGLFSRVRGDVFCLAPPMVTSHAQLDQIVEILRDSIIEVLGS